MNERWLVIRFRALGDCVMAAWPTTALRESDPTGHITWAVEDSCVDMVDVGRLANQVAVAERKKWKQEKGSPKSWGAQLRFYLSLRKHNFTHAVDFQGHTKTALCLRLSGARRRISIHPTDALSKLLNPHVGPIATGEHRVEYYFRALRVLKDVSLPTLPILPEGATISGLEEGEDWVSINTGSSSINKAVPIEAWESVAAEFVKRGRRVVAIGGPKDPPLDDVEGVLNLVGKTSLKQTLSLLRASRLHISADTGTGHMASGFGVPTVTIFSGEGHSPEQYAPYGEKAKSIIVEPSLKGTEKSEIVKKIRTKFEENALY